MNVEFELVENQGVSRTEKELRDEWETTQSRLLQALSGVYSLMASGDYEGVSNCIRFAQRCADDINDFTSGYAPA